VTSACFSFFSSSLRRDTTTSNPGRCSGTGAQHSCARAHVHAVATGDEQAVGAAASQASGAACGTARRSTAVHRLDQLHTRTARTWMRAASPGGVCCGMSGRMPRLMTARAAQ
jgi:hypothetical protein